MTLYLTPEEVRTIRIALGYWRERWRWREREPGRMDHGNQDQQYTQR